jgi:hypothetical protein
MFKHYVKWAFADLPTLAERERSAAEGIVQEAYFSAQGELIAIGFVAFAAFFAIGNWLLSGYIDSDCRVGLVTAIFPFVFAKPADWYIKRRIRKSVNAVNNSLDQPP